MDRRAFLRHAPVAAAATALPTAAFGAVATPEAEHPNDKVRRLAREIMETLKDPEFLGFRRLTITPDMVGYDSADEDLSSEERRDRRLAEFQNACTEVEPALCEWIVNLSSDGNVLVFGRIPTGTYEGDGLYEGATLTAFGKRIQYHVKLLRYRLDGHRVFEVRCPGDVMRLPENRFRTFIGRKLSA